MRKLGIALTALGIIWGILAFNMKTTVVTEGKTIGSGEYALQIPSAEINNIGLMDDRRNHLTLAGVLVVAGVLLVGFGTLSGSQHCDGSTRKCPFCAEPIRTEAIKCRHCNSAVGPLSATKEISLHGRSESYIKPLPAMGRALLTRKNLSYGALAASVLSVWVLFLPTTVELDLAVCRNIRTSTSSHDEVWRHQMKLCMESKFHHIKVSVMTETMRKNAINKQKIAEARAKQTEIESQTADSSLKPVALVARALIGGYESMIESNDFLMYAESKNWE